MVYRLRVTSCLVMFGRFPVVTGSIGEMLLSSAWHFLHSLCFNTQKNKPVIR
jgi:hypothetical protein